MDTTMQGKGYENKTMHINDYFWPKCGTNLKISLHKHEGNSVHIIIPQNLDQLYSITAGMGGGIRWNWYHNKNVMNSMKMKSKHGMKLLELSTLSHKWGEYHHSCFMLTLFWTISAAKNSVTFVLSFPHSLPYPHAQPAINFSTKCSSQIQQSMTSALCQNVNDTVAILGCWTAWHF